MLAAAVTQHSAVWLQATFRPMSEHHAVDRPSDAWAKHNSAPGYASFPSDIRHTKTRQALAQQGNTLKPTPDAFEEVQVGVLIGGSSSGNVYRGMWRSIPVCVKVGLCFAFPVTGLESCSRLLQAVLYMQMKHKLCI